MPQDIPIPKRFPELLVRSLLDRVASGQSLHEILEEFMREIENTVQTNMRASVLLLDDSRKRLRHGAAPNIPDEYNRAIDGLVIGPKVGSCGTAAYCQHPIYVVDIETDPLWNDFKDLARKHGLRSCWSVPILNKSNQVLGTFAMYYNICRSPNLEERALIADCAQLAAVLISEHAQHQERSA